MLIRVKGMGKLVKFQFNFIIKVCAAMLCSFFVLESYGQSFDDIVASNKYIDCKDVSYNAASIISEAYANNQTNRIYEFLDYWESKCGVIEPIIRLRTILDVNSNNVSTYSFSEETIEDLLLYRNLLNSGNDSIFNFQIFRNEYFPKLKPVNELTQEISRQSSSGTLDENLLLDFYADKNPTFQKIKEAPNSSQLKELHDLVYNQTLRMWQMHYAFIFGTVHHFGDISIFGTRPNLGIAFGAKTLRHNLDLVIDFRLGPSEEEYTFVYQGELLEEDTWTGVYLGFEYTYDIINTQKFDFGISPGLGYDNITAVNGNEDNGDDSKFLTSFNKNIGLVGKYKYGKRGGYIGLHVRYNWADYNNPGGTQLEGNYLNLRLTWGNIFSHIRNMRLRNLE